MERTSFARARTPANKERRSRDLLLAARSLAESGGVRTVTLTAIAERAGVHVSGVRRYFDSREEIFLRLATAAWSEWAEDLAKQLGGSETYDAARLARVVAGSLGARPLFCDLLGHAAISLERQVPAACVRAYKLAALDAVGLLADTFHRAAQLSPEAGRDLVASATALAAAFWQYAHPDATLAQLYDEEPRLAPARIDFEAEMTSTLTALITGLTATHGGVGLPPQRLTNPD
ncbi:TetR family transcriptional regulator [Streptomyces sp. OP7]|uniref:TetR/AcrR family transcriptional regulator n=1 Tax=Streptomyces sp. OP7 TaxID=3142462 RepID=UPI0032E93315